MWKTNGMIPRGLTRRRRSDGVGKDLWLLVIERGQCWVEMWGEAYAGGSDGWCE